MTFAYSQRLCDLNPLLSLTAANLFPTYSYTNQLHTLMQTKVCPTYCLSQPPQSTLIRQVLMRNQFLIYDICCFYKSRSIPLNNVLFISIITLFFSEMLVFHLRIKFNVLLLLFIIFLMPISSIVFSVQRNLQTAMKLFSLQILYKTDTSAKLLQASHELSDFGYFQRSSVREFMDFTAKVVCERTARCQRVQIKQQGLFHV